MWPTQALDDACVIEYGTRVVQKRDGGEGYPVYGGGGATFAIDRFNREDRVVVARFGMSEQCTRFVSGKFFLNDSGLTIRPSDPARLLPAYLDKWLLSVNDQIYALGKGTAQKNLDVPALRAIRVPVPSVAEQRRVIGVVEGITEHLARASVNTAKNLTNSQELFDSCLQHVFQKQGADWTERRMDSLCAITSALVDPRHPEYQDLLHVGAGNMESKTGELAGLQTAREEGLISGKFLFDDSMVLYSKIRPYLMKVARPDFAGLCSADVYPLAPLHGVITRDYLFYLLLSQTFTDYAIQGSARAGMPKVNREHLFAFTAWIPPIPQQKKFATQLDALHTETQRLVRTYEKKQGALDALRCSVLSRAFAAQL